MKFGLKNIYSFLRFCALALILLYPRSIHPVAASPQGVAGNTYLVNTVQDTPDADPADGQCADAAGRCSLRAAIMQANFLPGLDTIMLPAGLYQLTRAGIDDGALVGDLDISDDLVLQGAGPAETIVDGNGAVTGDRVFQVLPSAKNVEMTGLTIRNGVAPLSGSDLQKGGGVASDSAVTYPLATFQLKHVVIETNTSQDGAGLYAAGGQVILNDDRIRNNAASNQGGGLLIDGSQLTIQDSQAYSNTAYEGGAFYLTDVVDGLIDRTEIFSNTVTGYGGGIENSQHGLNLSSRVTLQDSSLHNNVAGYNGGGIDNYAGFSLVRTSLADNTAGTYGGGIMVYQTYYASLMSLSQSTLSGNHAQYGGGIFYNDFYGHPSSMTVTDSTLSGNSASHAGGGIYAIGQAKISLTNATVAGNEVYRFIGQHYPVFGGGLVITSTATITTENSLIADNYFSNRIFPPTSDDCYGHLISLGYNLILTTANCSISGTTYGNIVGQEPLLGPLQYNGGLTPTRALQTGSPAIEAGNNAVCPGVDQRGVPRPFDADGNGTPVCDIGAYEFAQNIGQSINFDSLPDKTRFDPPFVITATVSSGLQVSFNASPASVCALTGDSWFAGVSAITVSLKGFGDCMLQASQSGNDTYDPAVSVTQVFSVSGGTYLPVLIK